MKSQKKLRTQTVASDSDTEKELKLQLNCKFYEMTSAELGV